MPSAKPKSPSKLKRVVFCGLVDGCSKKAASKQSQGTIRPLAPQAAKPLQSARVPAQASNAAGKQPDRSAVIPDVALPDTKSEIIRRPTPMPSSSPYSSREASIRTPSNQKVPQYVVPMAVRPIPGSWGSESSQDTFHAARTPSSTGNNRSTSSGGNRKPSYPSSNAYKPVSYSRPAQTHSSTTYTPSYVPVSDYGSSHYGGHSSSGGWGGDSGGGSSGGGGSCGGGGGGGDGSGGGGGC